MHAIRVSRGWARRKARRDVSIDVKGVNCGHGPWYAVPVSINQALRKVEMRTEEDALFDPQSDIEKPDS